MKNILYIFTLILSIFTFGYIKGKSGEKNKQLKNGIENAIETKKRRNNRRKSDIDSVRRRLRKYTIE